MPTSKLVAIAGIAYVYIKPLLEELKRKGKIKSVKAGELATYWEIK